MSALEYYPKEAQQIQHLFGGAFVENKPIPFPGGDKKPYSNLFYWAHLEASSTSEFPLHPHKGFEIMTFVFEGSLEHYDTVSKVWTPLKAGALQVTQTGSGVYHSERITKDTRLFQIWFDPDFKVSLKTEAGYQDYPSFESSEKEGVESIEYVGTNSKVEVVTPNIEIKKMHFNADTYKIDIDERYIYSLYVLEGSALLNNQAVIKDDFLIISQSQLLNIDVKENLELFCIKSLKTVPYRTYA